MKRETVSRLIGIGDIHGCYELLLDLVERSVMFDPDEDRLVFLGDYLDRGANSKEVVDYVSGLKKHYPGQIVLLKGNHEDLALRAMLCIGDEEACTHARMLWYLNGGQATVNSFRGIEKARQTLIPFIGSLELYHETEEHIFVHAGIPYGKSPETASSDEILWDRSYSYNGRKTLIVGHSPKSKIERLKNIISLDTGAYMTGKLSGYDVLNKKAYQTAAA